MISLRSHNLERPGRMVLALPSHALVPVRRPNQVMHSDGAASAAPPVMTGR